MKRELLTIVLFVWALVLAAQQLPYQNAQLSASERADDLLGRLTLEEKVSLMMDVSPAIERLGIPQFQWWNEALHGVGRNGFSTVFPITMGMAASWDDQLLHQVFTAVSDEARAKAQQAKRRGNIKRYQSLSFWTPNINIFRDPRWGRGQETYGEDPYLTGKMGLAVVRGLQGDNYDGTSAYPAVRGNNAHPYRKLLACAKHFAVHSGPEGTRHQFNIENLPERDLWETYLPAFKTLVQEGKVSEIMCAYQRIDGQPCCGQHRYEQQILRDEWGFQGLITSDCGAIRDFLPGYHSVSADSMAASAKAILSGTDVECGKIYQALPAAVRRGDIKESDIDKSLRRLLIARFELGDLDDDRCVAWTQIPESVIACEQHRQLAYKMAQKSMVLLKNDGILPLKANCRIVVMGPNADNAQMQAGNYSGFAVETITALDGIRAVCPDARFVDGIEHVNNKTMQHKLMTTDDIVAQAGDADVVVFVGGLSPLLEGEEMKVSEPGFDKGDRTTIELPQLQRDIIRALHQAGKQVVYVNCSGSAVALVPEMENSNAIVQAWYSGEQGGKALADVLFGRYNPSGKLPVTFYQNDGQLPDFDDYTMKNRTYRYFTGEALFPFGYGLSYTTYQYRSLVAKQQKKKDVLLTFDLTNSGQRDGLETVQVYWRRTADAEGPLKTLCAYRQVALKAGETKSVTIALPRQTFEGWDSESNTMRVVSGQYELMVGASSADKDLLKTVVKIK